MGENQPYENIELPGEKQNTQEEMSDVGSKYDKERVVSQEEQLTKLENWCSNPQNYLSERILYYVLNNGFTKGLLKTINKKYENWPPVAICSNSGWNWCGRIVKNRHVKNQKILNYEIKNVASVTKGDVGILISRWEKKEGVLSGVNDPILSFFFTKNDYLKEGLIVLTSREMDQRPDGKAKIEQVIHGRTFQIKFPEYHTPNLKDHSKTLQSFLKFEQAVQLAATEIGLKIKIRFQLIRYRDNDGNYQDHCHYRMPGMEPFLKAHNYQIEVHPEFSKENFATNSKKLYGFYSKTFEP